jgi:hypothetical protein
MMAARDDELGADDPDISDKGVDGRDQKRPAHRASLYAEFCLTDLFHAPSPLQPSIIPNRISRAVTHHADCSLVLLVFLSITFY